MGGIGLTDKPKSLLYKLEPIIKRWPAVTKPEGHVHFRTKLLWSIGCLVLYFILANVFIYGLRGGELDVFNQFRAIIAGASGSLVHLGIGPIVTGSIIMQLFAGAKIINLDLTNAEDKAIYQGTQKVLVIVMIFVESVPQVFGFLQPDPALASRLGANGAFWAGSIVVLQLAIGSYLVFLMDEVVSKWGLGSGISLFIVAGVAQSVFTGMFNWQRSNPGIPLDPIANPPSGLLPKTWYFFSEMSTGQWVQGGFETLFLAPPNPVIALISTTIVFLVVVFAESARVELPLAHGRVRGARGRYPIRLIYASNIPVILAGALLANVNLIGLLLWNRSSLGNLPGIGHSEIVGGYIEGTTTPYSGIAYYLSLPNGVSDWLLPWLSPQYRPQIYGGIFRTMGLEFETAVNMQILLHVLTYATFMIGGSILFAIFWIETTNMGPEQVANQIQKSGMQIPGFRRDPRVTGKILARYIPVVTVIGGAAVGILAVFADLLGTLGGAGGTGLLLAVGILQRLYEQIAKEQAMEMHPVLRGFFGE